MMILVGPQITNSKSARCLVNSCGLECRRLVCGINW